MIQIAVQNLKKSYGANDILDNINLELKTNERIGIVGRNGCGKSTLFKILAKVEDYNGGSVTYGKNVKVGYLDQIPEYPETCTVRDVLMIAFEKQVILQRAMKTLEASMSKEGLSDEALTKAMNDYAELQENFEAIGGYTVEERVNRIRSGLNFSAEFMEQKFQQLSGGEKTKVILGKILLEDKDVLLLDEPTNHLDMFAIEWLEQYLKEFKGSVIMVSHDRYFLDAVVTQIIEIENRVSSVYHGNYSYYVEEKDRRVLAQLEEYKNQQKKIKSMEEAIQRFRDWGTRSDDPRMFKKARSMEKRIERMDKVDRPTKAKELSFNVEMNKRSGKEVVRVEGVTKAYDKMLLDKVDMTLYYGQRCVLLGANGCGKSTLLQMIMKSYLHKDSQDTEEQQLQDEGDIYIGSNVEVGYLDQNIEFERYDWTILECFTDTYPMPVGEARGYLARFLFYGEDVFKKVSSLSGGERSRLKIAMLLYTGVNLLILDEPTNHLDMASREVLEQALEEYKGTILFVSHDRYFMNKIASRVVAVEDTDLHNYDGGYAYYKEELKKKKLNTVPKQEKKSPSTSSWKDDSSYKQEERKKREKKQREKQCMQLEEDIEKVENKLDALKEEQMLHGNDLEKLGELTVAIQKEERILDELYEQWSSISSE